MSATNIQIAVKIRPLIDRELKEKTEALWVIQENSVVQVDYVQNCYSFDHIFDQHKTNKDVYDNVVNPLVISCLRGINSTIFAYGQTSSGKTHTMLGDKSNPGIINYAIEDIFKYIEENSTKNFLLRCSYLEIYNEKINDLLDVDAKDIKIREDCYQGVHVAVREEVIREKEELFILMKKGMKIRKIGCTDMNERSSRSHTIFKLIIQAQNKESEGSYTESSLSLVDLAGSERVGQMNLKGERQAEGVLINKSLTTLGLVIRKLSENEQFINYRDSKLTRLLQHSLGGNSRTLIICTITPAALDETKSTLEFAQRAKYVKNRPVINEKVTDKDQLKQYARLCQDYKQQIDQLSLERLEKEKTINTLRDKIHNIELFSSGTFEKDLKINKALPRRHTMGHYRPFKASSLKVSSGVSFGLDESSDEDNCPKQDTSEKSHITSEEKSPHLTDAPPTTPAKILRVQKALLEESYESLKCFTNYEKQFFTECDEIKELRDLANRLREENISLNQHVIKEREVKIKSMETHRDIYENLNFLKDVLEGKTPKDTPRKSLHTIVEEEQLDIFSDTLEVTEVQDWLRGVTEEQTISKTDDNVIQHNEDNIKLKNQIEEINSKINEKELIEAELYSKLSCLEKQIQEKDSCIDALKLSIKQEKDTKEAELDILNNKLRKLNNYKEEMHKKLSDIQKDNDNCVSKNEYDLIISKNVELQIKHDDLQRELSTLQELNESHRLQIHKFQEDIQNYKNLEIQCEALKLNSELLEEAKKEICDLKQVVKTEAETVVSYEDKLLELRANYSEMQQNQHVIDQRNIELAKQLEDVIAENNILQSKLDLHKNILSELEEMKIQNHNCEIKIDEMQKENNELKENISVSTSNFYNQQSLNLKLQTSISEYLTEITNLKEDSIELKNLKESFNKKIIEHDNLLKSLESLLAEKNDIQEKYHYLETEKENLNKNFIEMKSLNDNKNQESLDLLLELNDLKKCVHEFEQKENSYKQDITHLQSEISSQGNSNEQKLLNLNKQIKFLEEQNSDLNKQISVLTSQINNSVCHDDIKKMAEETESLKAELIALKEELGKVNELKNNLEEQNKKITEEKENIQQTIELRKQEHNELTTELHDQVKTLKDNLSKTNTDCEFYIDANKDLQRQLSELNTQLQKMESDLTESKGEVKKINTQRDNFEIETHKLIKENESIKESIKNKTEHIQQLEDKIQELEVIREENQKFEKLLALKNDECNKHSELNNHLEDQVSQLKIEREKALKDLSLVKEEMGNQKLNPDMSDIQLNEDILSLQRENSNLKDSLDSITLDYNTQTIENLELRGQLSELQIQITILKNDSSELKAIKDNLVQLTDDYESLQKSMKSLEEQKAAAQELNQCMELEINKKIEKLEEQSKELDVACANNDKLKLELIELTQKYDAINTDYNYKTEELNNAISTTDDLKVENHELQEQNSSLQYEVNSLKAEITELVNAADLSDLKTAENMMLKEERLKIQQSLEKLEEEKAEMSEKLSKLQRDIDERDMEITKLHVEISKINEALKQETTQTSNLRKEIKRLNDALQSSDCKDIQIIELTQKMKTLTDDYELKLKNVNDEILRLQLKNSSLDELIALKDEEFNQAINLLSEQLTSLTTAYEHTINELNGEIKTKKITIIKLEESLALQNLDRASIIEKKDMEILNLTIEVKKLKNYCEELNNIIVLTKSKLNSVEDSLKSANLDCTIRQNLISDQRNQIRDFCVETEQLNKLLDNHKEQLIDKNVAITNLKKEKNKIMKEKTDFEVQYSHISKENSSLKEKNQKNLDHLKKIQNEKTVLELKIDEQNRMLTEISERLQQNYEEKENQSKNVESDFDVKSRNIGCDESLRRKIADNVLKEKHIARLSDENRPLSPNEIRKIKRQSLHDQRRGLDFSSSESLEYANSDCVFSEDDARPASVNDQAGNRNKTTECIYCKSLQCLVDKFREEKEMLSKELMEVTEKNVALDEENEDMLKVIKGLEERQYELFEELQGFIGSDGGEKTNQSDLLRKKEELQSKLLDQNKLIKTYKDKIVDLECNILQSEHKHESLERDLKRRISELQCKIRKSPVSVADKETQAECDLNEKYKYMKALAKLRKEEGNHLRAQLNLPPNCPVLPRDIQSNVKPLQ